jgi:hypothetical protein
MAKQLSSAEMQRKYNPMGHRIIDTRVRHKFVSTGIVDGGNPHGFVFEAHEVTGEKLVEMGRAEKYDERVHGSINAKGFCENKPKAVKSKAIA